MKLLPAAVRGAVGGAAVLGAGRPLRAHHHVGQPLPEHGQGAVVEAHVAQVDLVADHELAARAQDALAQRLAVVGLAERVDLDLGRVLGEIVRELDGPVARAVVWSVGSWWLALWAGWQMDRQNGPIRALLPGSVILGLVLRSGGEQTFYLWVYLAALLLVLGLVASTGRIACTQDGKVPGSRDSAS